MAAAAHIPLMSYFEGPSGQAREERFWSKVAIAGPSDCWDWTGSLCHGHKGYGRFKLTPYAQARANRVAWALHHRRDPGDLIIRHHCDRPACCNPAHLEIGTHLDNSNDKISRGRARGWDNAGEKNPRAKLSEADLTFIIEGFRSGRSNKEIARHLPVDHALISRIRVGRSWARQAERLGWTPQPQFIRKGRA